MQSSELPLAALSAEQRRPIITTLNLIKPVHERITRTLMLTVGAWNGDDRPLIGKITLLSTTKAVRAQARWQHNMYRAIEPEPILEKKENTTGVHLIPQRCATLPVLNCSLSSSCPLEANSLVPASKVRSPFSRKKQRPLLYATIPSFKRMIPGVKPTNIASI